MNKSTTLAPGWSKARHAGVSEEVSTDRRAAIKVLGGGALALLACGDGGSEPDRSDAGTTAGGSDAAATNPPATCVVAPEETIGPYPDKTGMLTNEAFHRADITEGRPGLPLDVVLSIVSTTGGCAPIANASVIVWQCDAEGHYSEYGGQPGGYDGSGATFLRGVQVTDSHGQVTFKTIYPGWYQGRATHIHVQIFVAGVSKKITQLAFPETVSAGVYGTGVYASKGSNPQSNANDMVFADSLASELANLTGNTGTGYTATLTIGVPVTA